MNCRCYTLPSATVLSTDGITISDTLIGRHTTMVYLLFADVPQYAIHADLDKELLRIIATKIQIVMIAELGSMHCVET